MESGVIAIYAQLPLEMQLFCRRRRVNPWDAAFFLEHRAGDVDAALADLKRSMPDQQKII